MGKLEEKTKAEAAEVRTLDAGSVLHGDDILGGTDALRAVPVATPEWKAGSRVFVAELSADERDELEVLWAEYKAERDGDEADNSVGFRAFVVAFCLCDNDRYRLFSGRESEAAAKISKRNGKATSRLFNVCSRVNGLTKSDIDELEKN